MVVNIENGTGTGKDVSEYLSKEMKKNGETFFNHLGNFSKEEVVKILDSSNRGLKKTESKFFNVLVAPSQNELQSLSDDQLKLFGVDVMKEYAKNFNKNYSIEDFEYFIVLEFIRKENDKHGKFKKRDRKISGIKEGDQRHLHIIVKRKLKDGKRAASPMSKNRNIALTNEIKQGFDRNKLKTTCEELFDKMFDYPRTVGETFLYANQKFKESKKYIKDREFIKNIQENKEIVSKVFPNMRLSKLKKKEEDILRLINSSKLATEEFERNELELIKKSKTKELIQESPDYFIALHELREINPELYEEFIAQYPIKYNSSVQEVSNELARHNPEEVFEQLEQFTQKANQIKFRMR